MSEYARFVETLEKDGLSLGRYLNRGGFSHVWAANDAEGRYTTAGEDVAVKLMTQDVNESLEEAVKRFTNEAECHALVSQGDDPRTKNIAKLYSSRFDHEKQVYYLISELGNIDISFTEMVVNNYTSYSLQDIVKIMKSSAGAVDYCHEKGIVHNDLKPLNLIWSKNSKLVEYEVEHDDGSKDRKCLIDGELKLIDFGLARRISIGTDSSAKHYEYYAVGGTPDYIAPERFSREFITKTDTRADIFALGGIFYELLTGDTPRDLRYRTKEGLIEKILNAPVDKDNLFESLNRKRDEYLRNIVLNALSLNPEERCPSARELLERLEEFELLYLD